MVVRCAGLFVVCVFERSIGRRLRNISPHRFPHGLACRKSKRWSFQLFSCTRVLVTSVVRARRNNSLLCMGDFVVDLCFSLTASKVDLVPIMESVLSHLCRFRFQPHGSQISLLCVLFIRSHSSFEFLEMLGGPKFALSATGERCEAAVLAFFLRSA